MSNDIKDWISTFRSIHGQKYDYKYSEFGDSKAPIRIICDTHGEFYKSPSNHGHKTKPQGCPKCLKDQSTNSFLEELLKVFKEVHGSKYKYENIDFVSSKKPIKVLCPTHGEFSIRIDAHRNGVGCRKCKADLKEKEFIQNLIKEFHRIHGDSYDYGSMEYQGSNCRITILCKTHGRFKLKIASHRKGVGCPLCAGKLHVEKNCTDEFIKLAQSIHGDRYDYSLTEFSRKTEKVKIVCKRHGEFYQLASAHLGGSGCSACSIDAMKVPKISSDTFVERFRKVHGDKYTYQFTTRNCSVKSKITIICPEHGSFLQRIDSHSSGAGCSKCSASMMSVTRRLSHSDVIERFREIHGSRYDYSQVKFELTRKKVVILCEKHGEFELEVNKHLKGRGCQKCAMEPRTGDLETFLASSKTVHGEKYGYDNVAYENAHLPVEIVCPDHGIFLQSPNNHKRGQGCPWCGEFIRHLENKSPDTPTIVYYLTLIHNNVIFYKIGITTTSVKSRFRTLSLDNVRIIKQQTFSTNLLHALKIEQYIINHFREFRLLMDSVLLITKGGTECFSGDILGSNGYTLPKFIEKIDRLHA